jgi:hypothetical protein
MKFTALSIGLIAGLAAASPTPTANEEYVNVVKRAAINDVRVVFFVIQPLC